MRLITTPTFIIGLGGIGNAVVRFVLQRYRSSDRQVPETVCIRSIDTANQEPSALAPVLPDSMFTKLGEFQANEVIQRLDMFPNVARWWKYPRNAFAPGFIENGSGAKRPVGRLVFFEQFRRVYEALVSDFRAPKRDDVQKALIERGLGQVRNTPRVFIIGSLAGGTCAGTFLDIALLTRHLLRQQGYESGGATITGVFALPSVIHLESGDSDSLQARQRQVNAVAALSELDFLMCGWTPEELRAQYPDPVGIFDPQPPLFNQVYLFTDRKLHGVTFTRQADVLQRVAHFIFGQVALGMGEKTLQLLDNFKQYFDPAERAVSDGLPAIYGSFGVEWLEVPHDQLIARWCSHIADDLASRVAEYRWGEERPQNLDAVVRDKLTGGYEAYRTALDIVGATPDTVLGLRGMPDLQPFLDRIQGAARLSDLADSLRAFDAQLPGTLDTLRRLRRALPSRDGDEAWVRNLAAALLKDRSFRAGGARRVMEAAAAQLSRLEEGVESSEGAETVIHRCGGGLFRRLDHAPALVWAHERSLQQAKLVIRGEIGGRAAELAGFLRRQASVMEALQQAIRSEARQLGQATARAWSPPTDAWLLGEADIERAIGENREAVTDAAAQSVSESLAELLLREDLPDGVLLRERLGDRFREEAVEAIERESIQFTRRPEDSVQRIINRIEMCEPMAHLIDSRVRFLEVMPEERRATPLKIVLTEMGGDGLRRLQQWADGQRRSSGEQSAFQVASSGDRLRDDALHLTFGWPLWLFNEVRQCVETAQQMTADTAGLRNARVLGEVAAAADHQIHPLESAQTELLFAYAVILGLVKPLRIDRVQFDPGLFPGQGESTSLEDAHERFRRSGLNRQCGRYLSRRQENPREFMAEVRRCLERLDSSWDQVPPPVRKTLQRYHALVTGDLRNIVAL